ncbi:MAG: hypothetical protein ACK50J_11530, partial [Planctomyces sp.]
MRSKEMLSDPRSVSCGSSSPNQIVAGSRRSFLGTAAAFGSAIAFGDLTAATSGIPAFLNTAAATQQSPGSSGKKPRVAAINSLYRLRS